MYPDSETFGKVQREFTQNLAMVCIERLQRGWEELLVEFSSIGFNPKNHDWMSFQQRERSLVFLHATQIAELQSIEDPFIFIHEAPEFESSKSDRAMPPSYDLAFYKRGGNRRIAFPVEAKYLKNPKDVTRLCSDLTKKYLTEKGSPISDKAVIIAYLLKGLAQDVPSNIESEVACALQEDCRAEGTHWRSKHKRKDHFFRCFWLIFSFEREL